MKNYIRIIAAALGLVSAGMAVDDGITDRYKNITPKEFLAASATFLAVSLGTRPSKNDDDEEEEE